MPSIHEAREACLFLSVGSNLLGDCALVSPELFRAVSSQSVAELPDEDVSELLAFADLEKMDMPQRREALQALFADIDSQSAIALIDDVEFELSHAQPPKRLNCAFIANLTDMANHIRERGVVILAHRFD